MREVMFQRNSIYKLQGDSQVVMLEACVQHDAGHGGEQPALPGKTGRGARGKVAFVVAVSTRGGRSIHIQLRCVVGVSKQATRDDDKANVAA